jgi:hypothetical protein
MVTALCSGYEPTGWWEKVELQFYLVLLWHLYFGGLRPPKYIVNFFHQSPPPLEDLCLELRKLYSNATVALAGPIFRSPALKEPQSREQASNVLA